MSKLVNPNIESDAFRSVQELKAVSKCSLAYLPVINFVKEKYENRSAQWHEVLNGTIIRLIVRDIENELRERLMPSGENRNDCKYEFYHQIEKFFEFMASPDMVVRRRINAQRSINEAFIRILVLPDEEIREGVNELI